jgi:hypothetical protein
MFKSVDLLTRLALEFSQKTIFGIDRNIAAQELIQNLRLEH